MLEDLLKEMSKFGQITLGQLDSGKWYCRAQMFIHGDGISFVIKSELDHVSPLNAAHCAFGRMQSAFNDIEKTRDRIRIEDKKLD